jgi:ketosteroid isomerase-like protein
MSFRLVSASIIASFAMASSAYAASPAEVVQRHVDSMKTGDITRIMDDYSADTVVITPKGLVAGQTPADGPGVYSGSANAQRVFATITAKPNLPGVKAMETRIAPVGTDGALLYWVQNKGQPNEVSGKDVFIVRNDKIVYQAILVD